MAQITLQLSGLHCNHCVKSVENALNALPKVTQVQIDLATQKAMIEGEAPVAVLVEAIEEIGFEAQRI